MERDAVCLLIRTAALVLPYKLAIETTRIPLAGCRG